MIKLYNQEEKLNLCDWISERQKETKKDRQKKHREKERTREVEKYKLLRINTSGKKVNRERLRNKSIKAHPQVDIKRKEEEEE